MVKTEMYELEAFALEIQQIRLFGRVDLGTGCLLNMTDGGDGSSGFSNPGNSPSEETKRRISRTLMGHRHSDETKRKIGEAGRGRITSDITKEKLREAIKSTPYVASLKRRIRRVHWLGTKDYESLSSVKNDGFNISAVGNCLRERSKQSAGYKWEYIDA